MSFVRVLPFLLVASACASRTPDSAAPQPSSLAAPINIVESTVVVGSCPDAKWMNSKQAEDSIRKLVEPCAKVPGGMSHFAATLQPGGRIELAGPDGDPASGIVPTCVLEHQLTHRVLLKNACKFDVHLSEGKMQP